MSSSNNPSTKTPDYKAKLDEIAYLAKHPEAKQTDTGKQGSGIVEKVAQYIPEPISSKVLGKQDTQEEQHKSPPPVPETVPPKRPDHDEHIQEFLRDQHRSTGLQLEE